MDAGDELTRLRYLRRVLVSFFDGDAERSYLYHVFCWTLDGKCEECNRRAVESEADLGTAD